MGTSAGWRAISRFSGPEMARPSSTPAEWRIMPFLCKVRSSIAMMSQHPPTDLNLTRSTKCIMSSESSRLTVPTV